MRCEGSGGRRGVVLKGQLEEKGKREEARLVCGLKRRVEEKGAGEHMQQVGRAA